MPSKWNVDRVISRIAKGESQDKIARAFRISRFGMRGRVIKRLGELAGRKSLSAQVRAGTAAWKRMRKEVDQARAEKLKKRKAKRKPVGLKPKRAATRKVVSRPKPKKKPGSRHRKM